MKTTFIAAYFLITVALHVTAEDFQNTEYYRDYLKFLKVSGAEASQKLMVQQMFDQIKKAAPGKISADRIEQQMVDELSLLNEQLFPVYKKHLTHQDLKAIIAFYETPIGKISCRKIKAGKILELTNLLIINFSNTFF